MNIFKTKTFWSGVASVFTGIGLMVAGEIPVGINAVVSGVLAICVRDGIAKLQK